MRRFFMGMAIGLAALSPNWAKAEGPNQAQQVAAALRESGQLKDYSIKVKYDEGTVWLRGQVTSRKQLRDALEIAGEVPGVDRVVNELTVEAADEQTYGGVQRLPTVVEPVDADQVSHEMPSVSDSQIANHVARSFKSGGRLKKYKIGVNVNDGVVILRGTVTSQQQMQIALQQARQVPGVRAVRSELGVAGRSGVQRTAYQDGYVDEGAPLEGIPEDAGSMGAVESGVPMEMGGAPLPMYGGGGGGAAQYDEPYMPNHAWPSYASYPNYGAVSYPRQYSATAWPYIGPFYPYPQVPLGWRKVTLEWDDGWWFLDFKDR